MDKTTAELIIKEIFDLYELHGDADYIGEPVSQLEHMLQAGQLALEEGFDDEMILAAFFHDIGHLFEFTDTVQYMDGLGVIDHEELAYHYLIKKGFSKRIALLVKSHVDAKRYLTSKYPSYYDQLSPASRQTLVLQGGRMSEEEIIQFESNPFFHDYIKMRYWDDKAKVAEKSFLSLDFFKEMALLHLLIQSNKN